MPVTLECPVERMSQDDFGRVAYAVMRLCFEVRAEFGAFFDERIYAAEIARRIEGARQEFAIHVSFGGFKTTYFLDLFVSPGAAFELKAVRTLSDRHRSQLLNYLLLMELSHGKLVNVRPDRIKHEFVNSSMLHRDRVAFAVDASHWHEAAGSCTDMRQLMTAILRDWGTGLDLSLYSEALTHFLGGDEAVLQPVDIVSRGRRLGQQILRLAAPHVAFKITALPLEECASFEQHAIRFLQRTTLQSIQWINITHQLVTFRSLDCSRAT